MDKSAIPADYEALRELYTTQQAQMTQLQEFVQSLLEQIRLSRHQHFGARSEAFNVDQLSLLTADDITTSSGSDNADSNDPAKDDDGIDVPAHRRKRGKRKALPPDLPRINIVHTLEGEACQCEQCNSIMSPISERIYEQLDLIPATVQVMRNIKTVYGCSQCEGQIKTAPMPPQILPKCMASPGTLAHIVTAKFVDSLPLYRQEKQFQRMGIDLPRSTMAHWMIKAGDAIVPLVNLLNERMLSGHYIGMDETTIQVLKELGKKAQSKSYLWVRKGGPPGHPIVLYDYDPSRSQAVPVRLLDGFAGYLQADGYEGYGKVCSNGQVTRVGCMAHARRKFDEAVKSQLKPDPHSLPGIALKKIKALYRIEREAADLTSDERRTKRQQEAVPLLNDLRQWLDEHLPLVPKQSALGKALNYLHKQWPTLIVYTEQGDLRIDNNQVENAVRPFVVGRKNYLFCDSVAGAKATANLYSLIETAKANGIEPYRYLRHVFTELPKATSLEDFEALLPHRMG
ncbi:IS66 family transposase [Congregibacter litoralis]|uniref:Transposase n=1 Tax=Congregibacter litoralis KT71 TaxID=314285 RepID=A4A395_9GAMM|nr:IS66 family transposase [Congregibacter litoralis]EAQ99168.1 Transposase [Congregibacter litoralis KT71]